MQGAEEGHQSLLLCTAVDSAFLRLSALLFCHNLPLVLPATPLALVDPLLYPLCEVQAVAAKKAAASKRQKAASAAAAKAATAAAKRARLRLEQEAAVATTTTTTLVEWCTEEGPAAEAEMNGGWVVWWAGVSSRRH